MKTLAALAGVLAVAACPAIDTGSTPDPQPVVVPPDPGAPPVMSHWDPVSVDAGRVSSGPVAVGRRTRRLSVEQLRASLPAVFDGETWRFPVVGADGGVVPLPDGGELSVFPIDFVAPVLGEADYLTEFRESQDVTPTFLKLLDNAASNVCVRVVSKDLLEPVPARRVFVRFLPGATASAAERDQALRDTLRFVRLKYHAVYVPPNDTQAIADLEAVYRTMLAKRPIRGDADAGTDALIIDAVAWMAVCVHTVTDPAFLLY
jgi:hypothetical protein